VGKGCFCTLPCARAWMTAQYNAGKLALTEYTKLCQNVTIVETTGDESKYTETKAAYKARLAKAKKTLPPPPSSPVKAEPAPVISAAAVALAPVVKPTPAFPPAPPSAYSWQATQWKAGARIKTVTLDATNTLESLVGELSVSSRLPFPMTVATNSFTVYPKLWCDPAAVAKASTKVQVDLVKNVFATEASCSLLKKKPPSSIH
jgi:hypothetical protein